MIVTDKPDLTSISSDTLNLQHNLPTKPQSISLEGRFVDLVPVDVSAHAGPLFSLTNGSPISILGRHINEYNSNDVIWKYSFDSPSSTVEELAEVLTKRLNTDRARCFCVIEKKSKSPVGIINYLNNYPEHLKIELGGIWFSPIVQGTKANTEAVLLLLEHAFSLGYLRVEWKCDDRNQRSKKAALRLGFKFEAIQESHMIVKGETRNTAWFRLLHSEWEDVRYRLKSSLYAKDELWWESIHAV